MNVRGFLGNYGWGRKRRQQYVVKRRRRRRQSKRGFFRSVGYYGRYNRKSSFATARGEQKFHDLATVESTVSNTGAIVEDSCNHINQGTGESQRIGRRVTIRSIAWKYTIRFIPNQAPLNTDDTVRIILYWDRQANGATASVADILEDADYNSFYNLVSQNRFRILMDRKYNMNPTGTGDGTTTDVFGTAKEGRFYKKCSIPIEYSSSSGVMTEIRSNNIGILMISRAVNLCSMEGIMRLRFTG